MALKLMYITNQPEVAKIAESAGVDRIFIDLEYIGKSVRQGGMDSVKNRHTVEDVKRIRETMQTAQLMVRVNPLHEETKDYISSEEEISSVIDAGADLVMLPYFHTSEEVKRFVHIVGGKAKTFPLVESKDSLKNIDEILDVPGIDEIHIGINDLSLDLKKKFMFELLADGTVEELCRKFKKKGIPYGFGGIGRIGKGELPAECIIKEHYRLGSSCAILSRSFCNVNYVSDLNKIEKLFMDGVKETRLLEAECEKYRNYFEENERMVIEKVAEIVEARK